MRKLLTSFFLLFFFYSDSQIVFSTTATKIHWFLISPSDSIIDTIPKNLHTILFRFFPAANDTNGYIVVQDDSRHMGSFDFTQTSYSSNQACYNDIILYTKDKYNLSAQPTYRQNHFGYQDARTSLNESGADSGQILMWNDSIWIPTTIDSSNVDTLSLPYYYSISSVDDTTFTIDKLTGVVDTVRIARGTVGVPTIYAIRTTSTATSFTANDFMIKTITNSFSVTLPTAVGITGKIYRLKNRGSGTVITLLTTSSQTIDEFASGAFQLDYGDEFGFMSDGSNWLLK